MFSALNRPVSRIAVRLSIRHNSGGKSEDGNVKKPTALPTPPDPDMCCGSGCPTCVWVRYAEELRTRFPNGSEMAMKTVDEEVDDESLKVFLKMQIKLLEEEKKNKQKQNERSTGESDIKR
ncbi:hypothetical protein B4U80_01352 [Leptotrombidium deliense]|uniref:Oxidoreductase-like domain-containing protein n=1 Tax=Leptotrombidium deliense TaxID=299467 RepID=A0A443SEU7_9ACAR|nr:hypothetical protein B4U80_01352 [Leptotrombidium deliense]